MINPFKWKSKAEASNTDTTEEVPLVNEEVVEEPKEVSPLEGLSLEERLETMGGKKDDIAALNEERQKYYIAAKNFEDKINVLGVTEETKKEIRDEVMAKGGEISEKIGDIRNKYGLVATPVEVYSVRYKMIEAEYNRVMENMAHKHREALKVIDDIFPERSYDGYNYNEQYGRLTFTLNHGFSDLAPVKKFIELRGGRLEFDQKEKSLKDLKEELEAERDKLTIYKTPGELNEAVKRSDRLNHIWTDVHIELRNAEKKEDRFKEQN